MSLKNPQFHHLRCHLALHKRELSQQLSAEAVSGAYQQVWKVALALGALDCLYWQALGLDERNLAKGIRRLVTHSYRHHPLRLAMAPGGTATKAAATKEAA